MRYVRKKGFFQCLIVGGLLLLSACAAVHLGPKFHNNLKPADPGYARLYFVRPNHPQGQSYLNPATISVNNFPVIRLYNNTYATVQVVPATVRVSAQLSPVSSTTYHASKVLKVDSGKVYYLALNINAHANTDVADRQHPIVNISLNTVTQQKAKFRMQGTRYIATLSAN